MKIRKHTIALTLLLLIFCISEAMSQKIKNSFSKTNEYTMIVEGYDWGAMVSRVILNNERIISSVNMEDFTVVAERKTECVNLTGAEAKAERSIVHSYVSDAKGNVVEKGSYITLVLQVGPNIPIANAFQYSRNKKCSGNKWVDYSLLINNTATNQVWNNSRGRIIPALENFNLSGAFTHDKITLAYAAYAPQITSRKQSPLIIWLHGGGEGGTDPTIPLLANKAANYAAPEIQKYFGGAYVLVPQTPTRWMESKSGETTRGKVDDIYNPALMALIKDYVSKNPGIDQNRIYIGGCSNGGYMSLKLILLYPDYFAAGFISALAYQSEYINDKQIESIKNVPIWFIHSKDDQTTKPEQTVIPVYKRLKSAGAPNLHFSYYDHVIDLSGFFGGEDYRFNGHWSWIYSHVNHCDFDYDGEPVLLGGKSVTLMEWMAAQ
jgi:predicted peptidase